MTVAIDRHELQQIIAGLNEGLVLVEPGQAIVYANEAALTMHGVEISLATDAMSLAPRASGPTTWSRMVADTPVRRPTAA